MLSLGKDKAEGKSFAERLAAIKQKDKKKSRDKEKGASSSKAEKQLENHSSPGSSDSSSDSSSDESTASEEEVPVGEKRKRRLGKLHKNKIARIAKAVANKFRQKQIELRQKQERYEARRASTAGGSSQQTGKSLESPADASNRSILVDEHDNWVYATPEDIANPVGGYIIQLVNNAWQRGTVMDPFVLNPVVAERFSDWCDYENRLQTHLKLKGDVSQCECVE